jgi:hypothetical protein
MDENETFYIADFIGFLIIFDDIGGEICGVWVGEKFMNYLVNLV